MLGLIFFISINAFTKFRVCICITELNYYFLIQFYFQNHFSPTFFFFFFPNTCINHTNLAEFLIFIIFSVFFTTPRYKCYEKITRTVPLSECEKNHFLNFLAGVLEACRERKLSFSKKYSK